MLEFMLRESEQLGGKIRRYTSPDEHAFYPGSLPLLVVGAMDYADPLVRRHGGATGGSIVTGGSWAA